MPAAAAAKKSAEQPAVTATSAASLGLDPIHDRDLVARIAALPAHARDKLRSLRQSHDARLAHGAALHEQIQNLAKQRGELLGRHAQHERDRDYHSVKYSAEEWREVESLKEAARAIKAESTRLSEEAAHGPPDAVNFPELMAWIGRLPAAKTFADKGDPDAPGATRIESVTLPKITDARVSVSAKKGETDQAAFEREHAELESLRAMRKAAERAPLSLDEATAQARRDIDRLAAAGKPDISRVFKMVDGAGKQRFQGHIEWPYTLHDSDRIERGTALLAWLFRDELVAKVTDEIAAAHDPSKCIPEPERAARLAEIDTQILKQQRILEAWREKGACTKSFVTDPRAILGIEITKAA